jgi:predicted nucleic acid-binding protein
MILLDSSVLIDFFRKTDKKKTLFYQLSKTSSDFCISSVTHYEIGIGNRKNHFDFWEKLTKKMLVIPFDQACSVIAIDIYVDLKKSNKMIDLADLLIGATALTFNFPLATLNKKHFDRIKNLEIIN